MRLTPAVGKSMDWMIGALLDFIRCAAGFARDIREPVSCSCGRGSPCVPSGPRPVAKPPCEGDFHHELRAVSNPVVLAQADAVEYEALSFIGQCRQVDVFAAF